MVKKYFDYLELYLASHNLFNRTAILFQNTVFPLSPELTAEYEDIHLLSTEGMILAERQCRQLYRGAHSWSVAFTEAQSSVIYWTMYSQKLMGIKVDTKKLMRSWKSLGSKFDLNLSISEAYAEKDKAWETYKETKGNSLDLQHGFLETLATAQAEANNISVESALKSLCQREDQRRASRAIKKLLVN